jgi:hypothetical protein
MVASLALASGPGWDFDDTQGAVAQLGERQLCKLDVVGSIPISSTRLESGLFFDNCIGRKSNRRCRGVV